jgi:hypothetical protein
LVDLLRELYYKFPFTKFIKRKKITKMMNISRKKFIMVKALSLSLDIDFGYFSYDKLRNLFTTLVNNDEYPIPGEKVALLEYKRILSQGMAEIVRGINNRIITNPKLLLSKFEVNDKIY